MNFKRTLLASASGAVLLFAASSGAMADQIVQNGWTIDMVDPDPTHTTMDQRVIGGSTFDSGSLRTNTIDGDYSSESVGISHDQQNNGNNNAMGIAANVL